jgi:quinol monooxygenase YgiN
MCGGMTEPITSIARYRVKAGRVDEFLAVIDRHWATLRELELVTDRDAEVYLGDDRDHGGPLVVEVFDWVNEDAAARAHTHPLVSEVWEAMAPLCEARSDAKSMDFVNLQRLSR